MPRWRGALLLLLLAGPAVGGELADTEAAASLPPVVVLAPLPGADVPPAQLPANVQSVAAATLRPARALSVADALVAEVGSLSLNDTQGNPFQPDLNFRGFTGSPVLGTPQGISVYVDGVRVNEAFGDGINWDLIPQMAVARADVIPGSNPLFGLNTLGGAVVLTTKRGVHGMDTSLDLQGGSFGRQRADAEWGDAQGPYDYYLAGSRYRDSGWADHNPSVVTQGFGKFGRRDEATDASLTVTAVTSQLQGNQTLPRSWLEDPQQAYTWPDRQSDQLTQLGLNVTHQLDGHSSVSGALYGRRVRTDLLNSNVNGNYDPAVPISAANPATDNAIEAIDQQRLGASLQWTRHERWMVGTHTLVAGLALDRGLTDFSQFAQAGGTGRETLSAEWPLLTTRLRTVNRTMAVYAADSVALGPSWALYLAGRYDDADVTLRDRLGTALNGAHGYGRFNPAVGLTYALGHDWTLYLRTDQGSRVPTPVELTCADPAAPCSLPNAFSADPALRAVIARTVEGGLRGTLTPHVSLTTSVFRTRLDNDIAFIASGSGAVSAGYFQNVGQTQRQGLELGVDGDFGAIRLRAHYTALAATYRTALVLNSPDNSAASGLLCATCTDIRVSPGASLPGIPRQVFKLRGDYVRGRAGVGLSAQAQSAQFARGDESNQDANGALPGYLLLGLDGYLDSAGGIRTYLRIDNLLDRHYASFGVLGQNVFTAPGQTFDTTGQSWRAEQFRSVGAPRGVWVGVNVPLGRR